jgi:hypothetical protein
MLVVVPEEVDCFETLNVLYYYDFPINVEEDNPFRQTIKTEMGFEKEEEYPLLMIDSSTPEMPPGDFSTKD